MIMKHDFTYLRVLICWPFMFSCIDKEKIATAVAASVIVLGNSDIVLRWKTQLEMLLV